MGVSRERHKRNDCAAKFAAIDDEYLSFWDRGCFKGRFVCGR
jgi:hypothetical protein